MNVMFRTIAQALLAGGVAVAAMGAPGALAQEAQRLGNFQFWSAWKGQDANGAICYVSSNPQEMLPTNVDHGSINFLIVHRKGLGTKNEVQSVMGYNLEEGSNPTVTVDGKRYVMVTEGSAAWLASPPDTEIATVESQFVADAKAGATMVVKARSQRGTDTTYTYSLNGITAAMEAIDKACA